MEVHSHDDEAEQLPPAARDRLLDVVDRPASVDIIAENLPVDIPPRYDAIDGALKFDLKSPWNAQW
jgi:hypothetical protein